MIALSWVTDSTAGLAWTIPVSAGMVALVSPWSRQFAWRIGAIDRPAARKLHLRATPRLGGLSAALAVFTCVVLWLMTDPTAIEQCAQYWGLLPGALVMFLVGLYDDLFRLRPSVKLALQFVAASIICSGGICLTALDVPLLGQLHLSWLGPVLTVIWLVGVTNAMNFLDGIDGLAAGTAALASSSFLLVAGFSDMGSMLGLLSTVLIGACVVLVVNNFRSPKLFLGDSGSLLLGIMVASMGILAAKAAPAAHGPPIGAARLCLPIIVLAVPLIDMLACIIRRLLVGRSVFAADRGHIHHMLLAFGLRPPIVVAILCVATGLCGLIAAYVAYAPRWTEPIALAVVALVAISTYRHFGYLAPTMWLRCRRANRVLARLLATARAARARTSDGLEARTETILTQIRRACRALGIEYLRLQPTVRCDDTELDGTPVLEIGVRPRDCATTRLTTGRDTSGGLLVNLGEGTTWRPASAHAKELLITPLLIELARQLAPTART